MVRSRFLRYDRSFDRRARVLFEKAIGRLEASLSALNDQQIVVALSEAVALSGNAHTRLYLLRNRTELRRLPVRAHWFTDGLFVVRATGPLRDTLGCRVASVAGRDPRKVKKQVARLFAGDGSWVDYKSPYFLTSPEILYGLGMIAKMISVPFRFDCPERDPFQLDLEPLPLERTNKPTEEWHALSPDGQGDGGSWTSALPAVGRTPTASFVLDLQFNTGGNNSIAAPFMERLVALEKEKKIGKLFVIIGRATLSAGISHAAYLKQFSNATFIGEPVGDKLDTWSEGGNIVLPNSGLTVHFTNGFTASPMSSTRSSSSMSGPTSIAKILLPMFSSERLQRSTSPAAIRSSMPPAAVDNPRGDDCVVLRPVG